MSSRSVVAYFFTRSSPVHYKCNICSRERKQAPGTGYTKLLSHLNSAHPSFADDYAEFQRQALTPLEVFGFVDETTSDMYDWMRWIVERNLPLSEMEDPLTRKLVKMTPTMAETLKGYMRRVAVRVGQAIGADMGDTFGLMFDGWSSGSFHFLAVLAVYSENGEHQERVIGLSPMEDGQTADAHVEHIESILSVYSKDWSMVKFLLGDNCNTNQAIADLQGIPLVGCASHRFNLAVVLFLAESEDLLSQIQKLMIQLRTPNNAAELANHTKLRAVRANATRWSSVYAMIDRYVEIRDAILCVAAVKDAVPRGAAQRRIAALHAKLSELDSVCVKLQYPGRTLADVRVVFDACIEKYPIMKAYLDVGADIVHSANFERAVVKLINEVPLNAADKVQLAALSAAVAPTVAVDQPADFATEILRRAKKPRTAQQTPAITYMPLARSIPPTSNHCERFFSECNKPRAMELSTLLA